MKLEKATLLCLAVSLFCLLAYRFAGWLQYRRWKKIQLEKGR